MRGDIRDAALVRDVFESFTPSAVLHLAAESHVDRSIDGPDEFVQTNIVGTFTLLQEARRYWERLRGQERDAYGLVGRGRSTWTRSIGSRCQGTSMSSVVSEDPSSR